MMCVRIVLYECIVARCMLGGREREIVRIVVRSDKLIKLIRSGHRCRDTQCNTYNIGYMGGSINQSINHAQNIQHRCAGAHNLLDLEERTMENETRIT